MCTCTSWSGELTSIFGCYVVILFSKILKSEIKSMPQTVYCFLENIFNDFLLKSLQRKSNYWRYFHSLNCWGNVIINFIIINTILSLTNLFCKIYKLKTNNIAMWFCHGFVGFKEFITLCPKNNCFFSKARCALKNWPISKIFPLDDP